MRDDEPTKDETKGAQLLKKETGSFFFSSTNFFYKNACPQPTATT
jgi:hypothetical protein